MKTNRCIFTIHSLTSIYNFYTRPSFPRNNIIVSFRFFSLPSPPLKEGTRCSPPEAKQKEPIKPEHRILGMGVLAFHPLPPRPPIIAPLFVLVRASQEASSTRDADSRVILSLRWCCCVVDDSR